MCIREPLVQKSSLLIQGSQVRGTGDVATNGAGEIINAECYAIFGNRGAEDGNIDCGRSSPQCDLETICQIQGKGGFLEVSVA